MVINGKRRRRNERAGEKSCTVQGPCCCRGPHTMGTLWWGSWTEAAWCVVRGKPIGVDNYAVTKVWNEKCSFPDHHTPRTVATSRAEATCRQGRGCQCGQLHILLHCQCLNALLVSLVSSVHIYHNCYGRIVQFFISSIPLDCADKDGGRTE